MDFGTDEFLELLDGGLAELNELFGNPAGRIVGYTSSGHGSWEATTTNLFDIGDRVTIQRFGYDQIPAVYRAADLFTLASTARPGWLEQFAYVLPEAMASGLPVVATESGSIPEVVGDAGLIVPPSDFLGLARAFKELLLDEQRCQRLGQFAREWAQSRYDSRVVSSRIADEYDRLLER